MSTIRNLNGIDRTRRLDRLVGLQSNSLTVIQSYSLTVIQSIRASQTSQTGQTNRQADKQTADHARTAQDCRHCQTADPGVPVNQTEADHDYVYI